MATDIELIVSALLTQMGYRYHEQYSLPPYTVDFYLPEFKIAIEADGNPWHAIVRDKKRDLKLMEKYKVRVLHFADEVIKKYPKSVMKSIQEEICITIYRKD